MTHATPGARGRRGHGDGFAAGRHALAETGVLTVDDGMTAYPVPAPAYVIDHVFSGADHQHRRVQLPVECADRAVSWIRIQARTYGASAPEDHPIWGWIDTLHRATERQLLLTGAADLAFELDQGRVSWSIRRAIRARIA